MHGWLHTLVTVFFLRSRFASVVVRIRLREVRSWIASRLHWTI